jgi:hypothetical protein
MADKIQRVAVGLANILSLQGGRTPELLGDGVASVLDLLQFYGLQQLTRLSASDAALAPAGNISIQTPANSWCVLFGANARIVQVAAATGIRLNILLNRTANASAATSLPIASGGPLGYGAAFAGDFDLPWRAPFPLLLPPLSLIQGNLPLLTGVANASVNILAEVGILG